MKILDQVLKGRERRVYQRAYMGIEIRITSPELDGPLEATIRNISGGGLKVVADRELPVLSRLDLEFILPEDGAPVRCEGEVVWCLPNKKWYMKDQRGHQVGMRFVDLPQEERSRLVKFVFSRKMNGFK